LRAKLVLTFALVLACVSSAGIVYLQHRMQTSEDSRIAVMRIKYDLSQLQSLPWQVQNPGFGSPKQIRARIARDEERTTAAVARLQRTSPVPALDGFSSLLQTNFSAQDSIVEVGILEGWNNVYRTNVLRQAQTDSMTAATNALGVADGVYAGRARLASRAAAGGATIAIFSLFAAFAFFYRRSTRTQRGLEEALIVVSRAEEDRKELLARTVEVAEHERIRVASDLHDGPIQRLTALAFTIDRLARQVERGAVERLPKMIAEVRLSISREMDALRRLMVELRPPILTERGLAAALADVGETVFGEEETVCEVSCDVGDRPLAPEFETAVYRVVGEALVNARKYAEASRVEVVVEPVGDSLRVSVRDDGKGFDVDSPWGDGSPTGHGYGLMGIRERIEGLGGVVRIDGGRGTGVVVEATLPRKARIRREDGHELAVA
jgi:signal transduction histidine kinase